jgi:hypothetical protein
LVGKNFFSVGCILRGVGGTNLFFVGGAVGSVTRFIAGEVCPVAGRVKGFFLRLPLFL